MARRNILCLRFSIMVLFTVSLCIALCADRVLAGVTGYRSWYTSARNSFNRGKATYEELIKAVQDKEHECAILHSRNSSITLSSNATWEQGSESGSFVCLNQLQQIDPKGSFNINDDLEELNNANRRERVLAEGGCWQYVLQQVNALDLNKCDVKGEVSRSLIALAKTKCHFIRSGRAFPLAHHGCLLDPSGIDDNALGIFRESYGTNPCRIDYDSSDCEKLKAEIVAQCTNPLVMSESAFQMYHTDLNHIDDICFYLQSGEWNRRTEHNINKLGEAAKSLMQSQETMEDFLQQVQVRQEESLNKANKLSTWMDSIRDDMQDVFRILEVISTYQKKIVDFVHHFKLIFVYAFYALVGIALTLFEATAWARPRILLTIAMAGILDSLSYKICMKWLVLEPYNIDPLAIYQVSAMAIKWSAGAYCCATWLRAFISYQPPAQAMLKEMYQIRKILTPRVVYPTFVPEAVDVGSPHAEEKVRGYTLDDFVELFGDHSDSTYSYESGYNSSDSCSESLGEDSEGLVEEYLDSLSRRHRNRGYSKYSHN